MFTVGNRVMVKSKLNVGKLRRIYDNTYVSFVSEMDKTLGQKGIIVSEGNNGCYQVQFNDGSLNLDQMGRPIFWTYKDKWLLLLKNEVTVVEED